MVHSARISSQIPTTSLVSFVLFYDVMTVCVLEYSLHRLKVVRHRKHGRLLVRCFVEFHNGTRIFNIDRNAGVLDCKYPLDCVQRLTTDKLRNIKL